MERSSKKEKGPDNKVVIVGVGGIRRTSGNGKNILKKQKKKNLL